MTRLARIGLVVHPARDISEPLEAVRAWADEAGVEIGQVPVEGREREVAPPAAVADCELLVAIGGDGTTLAALRAASEPRRPVLGVACGSLGALTSVAADAVGSALRRFCGGDWRPTALPALELRLAGDSGPFALNDIAIVRDGGGQVRTVAAVDGVVFARFAGDGCIVSTAIGASAYALAAGGPLLMPAAETFVLTPLTIHGGFCPPLVVAAGAELSLEVTAGYGGARLEVDGQVHGEHSGELSVTLRGEAATAVSFADQEPYLTALRRRRLIIDSPRILAEDARQ